MKTKFIFLPILFLPFFLNGCIGIDHEFEEIRDEVIKKFGGEYKSEVQFSIGNVGISVSSWIADVAADEDLAADILDDVSSVQVGVYKKLRGTNSRDINALRDIEDKMSQSGWKSIVKSSEDGELTGIYIRKNHAEILDRMFVINLDDNELVLVDVQGDLKEAITTAIREKGIKANI
jgi:hypothetical protein